MDIEVAVDPTASHGGADEAHWWIPDSRLPSLLICDSGAATRRIERIFATVQTDSVCSRLQDIWDEHPNNTLGTITAPGESPSFRVENEFSDGTDSNPTFAADGTDDDTSGVSASPF